MVGKKMGRNVLAVVAAGVVVAMFASPSSAQKAYLDRLRKIYGLTKENSSCKTCHEFDKAKKESPDKKNLNVFGQELQKEPAMKPALEKGDEHKFTPEELTAVEAALKAIEGKDADGDGKTNVEELKAGTPPGAK